MALHKKLYVTGKREIGIRSRDPLEMEQVILDSVPVAVLSHSEGSPTVLSWLQRADATGAQF